MTVGNDHDPDIGKLVLGYEFDGYVVRYGSLTDDQIPPYNGQAITVETVHTVRNQNSTYMYFGSSPRVPRGTVVTVDGRSFPTDTESDDGSRGDRWNFPTGEMPTDLIWPTGQDVTVSVKFPESCPAATTELDYANSWPASSHSPHSLITRDDVSVLGDTLTVEVQPPPLHHQGTARAEVWRGTNGDSGSLSRS